MASISIRNLHKSFGAGKAGTTAVLKGIDLEIADGEFVILVGGSGCGKSTLLNIIAGLESASSGDVFINNRNVNGLAPKDRDIAMVFQSYALYPSMSVRENLAFGLSLRKMPAAEQATIIEQVASMLQITHLLDRKPAQLSGGQRQRVAMGRALARKPSLFLFDEPLSNLDAQLRVDMRAEIKLLHQRLGTTMVYVTHDQIEAMTLGDKIAVMREGVVQQFDSPQNVYERPANMYVASFMGAPPMNLLHGMLKKRGDAGWAVAVNDTVIPLDALPSSEALRDGQPVVLGLRPEQLTDASRAASHIQPVRLPIVLTEPTGADTLVTVKFGGPESDSSRALCRVNPQHLQKGNKYLDLHIDTSKAVLFDPTSQSRLL